MVDYNVHRWKQLRGKGVISAFNSFQGTTLKDTFKPIYVLGWCVELFSAAFYIPEDVIKRSVTRRGHLCWHLMDDVGKCAVNDAFLLQSIMFFFLDLHFKRQSCHQRLTQLFHKCFSEIVVEMGHLYQVQDDYLDCFGNPDVTGRYGVTIQGNRMTWFIIRSLEKVNYEQEKILKENYGKPGTERMNRVIKLFRELNLLEDYKVYEMKCYKAVMSKISKLPETIPALYFSETLDLILKREK